MNASRAVNFVFLVAGCVADSQGGGGTESAGGASGDLTDGSDAGSSVTGPDSGMGTTGEPPSEPGVHNTIVDPLPGGEVTACEWDWTVRTLTYLPGGTVPHRMHHASCAPGPDARMFTSVVLGADLGPGVRDETTGAVIVSQLDDATGTLEAVDQRHFPECYSTHGIAVSDDCQTIGLLCRVPTGTPGFDKDVLSTHPDADWMTQPNLCGEKMNDEMWLYEWTNGDIQSEPSRYIVHKAIGSWEYGNNYLRLGDDNTWGIAVKATVGSDEAGGCHEADAFLVMDRESLTMTTRGWSWACGTGHTIFNRISYDPENAKYSLLCSTDYNESEVGGLGAVLFRNEDGAAQEFHYTSIETLAIKGGASALVPRDGGGHLGLVVAVPGDDQPAGAYPIDPGTSIGLARWNSDGSMDGDIQWVVQDPEGYVGYSTLSVLSPGRYLLGWGTMYRLAHGEAIGPETNKTPWSYHLVEIDESGAALSPQIDLEDVGWGELDEMVPLGQGRAGWAYIPDPILSVPERGGWAQPATCNQPTLQLSVYTSPSG